MVATLVVYGLAIPVIRRLNERRSLAALPSASAGQPNVLVVVWDAVRHFDLSLYGYERPTTPALDQYAATGIVFDRAFTTAPWSLPSHASMLTGRYPQEMTTGHRQPLDGSPRSFPRHWRAAATRLGALSGILYRLQPDFGVARGFITWDAQPALSARTIIGTWWLAKTAWKRSPTFAVIIQSSLGAERPT
ncbi:MAG: sulfatase-like hydrolase/transferase [Gemmatimonadaceae bacterium]